MLSRAVKAARRVLAEETQVSVPVQIDKIAKRYAHVLEQNLPPGISGMLIPLTGEGIDSRWAIVVNRDDAPVRRRFSIAHELAHLVLHRYTTPHADKGFKVRFRDHRSSEGSVREEIEANQFAAEILMPEKLVLTHVAKSGLDYTSDTENDLIPVAEKFGVSVQALSFRIANLTNS